MARASRDSRLTRRIADVSVSRMVTIFVAVAIFAILLGVITAWAIAG